MTDRELADLRQLAKNSMDPYKDVVVCPEVLLELARGYEWGKYMEDKVSKLEPDHHHKILKQLAYPAYINANVKKCNKC